jgi:hypothetical protein
MASLFCDHVHPGEQDYVANPRCYMFLNLSEVRSDVTTGLILISLWENVYSDWLNSLLFFFYRRHPVASRYVADVRTPLPHIESMLIGDIVSRKETSWGA